MSSDRPTILLFGSPDFAGPTLEKLTADQRFNLLGVVTQPDQPAGRHQTLTPPPLKTAALKLDLPVYQFPSLKKDEAVAVIRQLAPDVIVVVAYGKIIPQTVLDIPRHGCLNIHPSLLPKYRGASPIQAVLVNGDATTGVTIMQLDAEMDHGPILAQRAVDILADDTAESLRYSLSCEGAALLLNVLPDYLTGQITPQEQDHAAATFTKLLTSADAKIDWSKSAATIDGHIRAYTPWPGAWTDATGQRVKILKAHLEGDDLIIQRVQAEGKQAMDYGEYLKGHQPLL
ncbi:MAG: methionyl-tRNA formyltransferase [Patescibacteria group bacterium]